MHGYTLDVPRHAPARRESYSYELRASVVLPHTLLHQTYVNF
jgi:hypothetical protein